MGELAEDIGAAFTVLFGSNATVNLAVVAFILLVVGRAMSATKRIRKKSGTNGRRKFVRQPDAPPTAGAPSPFTAGKASEKSRQVQELQEGFDFLERIHRQDELMEKADEFYGRKDGVLTWRESEFACVLSDVCEDRGLRVCPKVQIRELCYLKRPKGSSPTAQLAWDLVKMKHVDFLLCDRGWRPIAAVEYDDSSHGLDRETMLTDRYKESFFKAMNVPLVRVKYGSYSSKTLGALIDEAQPRSTGLLRETY